MVTSRKSPHKKVQVKTSHTKRKRKVNAKFILKPLKKGSLGVKFKNKASTRRKKEVGLSKKIGEKKVMGKLSALSVLNKNKNPKLSAKAKADKNYIAGAFIGKKKVRFPSGFSFRH